MPLRLLYTWLSTISLTRRLICSVYNWVPQTLGPPSGPGRSKHTSRFDGSGALGSMPPLAQMSQGLVRFNESGSMAYLLVVGGGICFSNVSNVCPVHVLVISPVDTMFSERSSGVLYMSALYALNSGVALLKVLLALDVL